MHLTLFILNIYHDVVAVVLFKWVFKVQSTKNPDIKCPFSFRAMFTSDVSLFLVFQEGFALWFVFENIKNIRMISVVI